MLTFEHCTSILLSVSFVVFSIDLTVQSMHNLFINQTRLNLEMGHFLKSDTGKEFYRFIVDSDVFVN